jgi:3-hydroxybutyryl-CoA dehydratase
MVYPFTEDQNFEAEFTVSPEIYRGFIGLFGDKNPMHTDSAYAAARGFKGIVMHGNILNGFLSYFIGELLPVKNVIIHTQEISYRKPVYLNDRLFFKAKVSEIHESVNVAVFKFSFTNQTGETAAKGSIQIGFLV